MPSPDVDIGTGITIDFGTTGFDGEILDVAGPESTREAVDVSHQGTVGGRRFIPGDLIDNGEATFDVHFNPDTDYPIDTVPEVITITWPAGAIWAFNAFMTVHGPSAPLEDKMIASVTLKVDGDITITPAS
jgi:hypothetical protein